MVFLKRMQGVAKTSVSLYAKTSKHRIKLLSLWFNCSKLDKQRLQVLYVGITFCSFPTSLFAAMAMLVVRMVFAWQGHASMKTATTFSIQGRFLARMARAGLGPTGHFFNFLIRPRLSIISSRLWISNLSSFEDKLRGSFGKIDIFFIQGPQYQSLYFK